MSVASAPIDDRPAAVYRLWAGDGALLYVGSSYDPEERCKQHRPRPWWPRATGRTDEWYDTRAEAFAAEYTAIWREDPQCNVWGTRAYAAQAPCKGRRSYLMWTGKRDVWPADLDQLKPVLAAYDVAAASPDSVPAELVERGEEIAARLAAAVHGLSWDGRRRYIWEQRRRTARHLRTDYVDPCRLAQVMAVANARLLALPHLFDEAVP
ncbi:hypothetical protein [Streptomyces mirabilis]|uniref:hypothetical protein n=1 Tax=Streptomyces mirabilis TaxID=68239 RepID=UPI0033BC5C9D